MKRVLQLLTSLLVCVLGLSLGAQDGRQFITDVEVTTDTSLTPQFSAGNVVNIGGKAQKWIVILVKYKTAKVPARTGGGFAWRDDLSIQFEALFNSPKGISLLSTKVDYWAVQFDGETNYAIAFIHPSIFERFAAPGAKPKKDSVPVRVSFFLNDAPAGGGYGGTKKASDVKTLFNAAQRSPNVNRVQNAILRRDQTPWSVLNFDAFELMKQPGK